MAHSSQDYEAVWHNDGHRITVTLDHSEVIVKPEPCPHGEGACRHPTAGCLVEYFINLFGLECNVGVIPAAPSIEIAWAVLGDTYDLDACQLWVIPVDDNLFSAWTTSLPTDD